MSKIIGRSDERELLSQLLKSDRAEFLALYGRRRVGKTYLIRNYFSEANCVFFHITGIQDGSLAEQLEQFVKQIGDTFYNGATLAPCKRWLDAFDELTKAIQKLPNNKKVVLFLDEFPWMATKRSRLLQALDHYWNRYWVNEPQVKLIVCGSSASWVIENIINNKGGLYNRITASLKLEPFSLAEVKLYLKSQGVALNNRHILELYMVIGGIPHYLSQIKKGKTTAQCVDELCFQKNGLLFSEFDRLFASLFNESEIYVKLCQTISKYRYGIGQAELIKESKSPAGGRTNKRLKELEDAGFIMSFIPYGHQEKGIYYKIIDEYTLFYFHWIKPTLSAIRKKDQVSGYWLSKSKEPIWKGWTGYAFEAICYKHISHIRIALQIDPGSEVGSWRFVPKKGKAEEGAQIDLLFDRPDGAVTICEIKYNEQPYAIDKQYAKNLLNKAAVYKKHTQTNKEIFIAMITSGGLKPTMYSEEMVSGQVTLDDLFKE
ncbi:MAG: AAA family ATPase [Alphaproteobacteria bacterium]|nr:AAA family ATPase [Alphaproteobacteria bacterium]